MKKNQTKIIIIATSILFLVAIFFIINYLNWKKYQNKIYPHTFLAGSNLSGQSLKQAENTIQQRVQKLKNQGLNFRHNNKEVNIPISVASFDTDLSYSLISFNVDDSVKTAFGNPSERTFKQYLLDISNLKTNKNIPLIFTINKNKLISILKHDFPNLNIKAQNAYFSVTILNNGQYKINQENATPGLTIDYQKVLTELKSELAYLKNSPIYLTTKSSYPHINKSDLTNLIPKIKSILQQGDFTLILKASSTQYWKVPPTKIITWINVNKNSSNQTTISLSNEKIITYLQTQIAPQINRKPLAPRFKIKNNKVISWQRGKSGLKLNLIKSAENINKNFTQGIYYSNLITTKIPENFNTKEKLDIRQILGTGKSNFAYSPPNRIHNIKVGLKTLQGLLIKPGENFSLNKALGKVNKSTGYLPELVIKNNETIPEYGGGLCQIATTIFRTALAAGLPITERQNHSYQVPYYKPTGTDATIYDPLPDLRFINNTGHYILIQGKIKGNILSFSFWGTSDGRIASTTTPVVYNLVKPPPTKFIPTTTLAPGHEKCTEGSHEGADAYFDYTVSYPPGSTTTPEYKKRFYSHYEPWQGVCLIGVKATSTTTSSTKTNNSY